MMPDRPLRVLIAKVGLDGHDRGAKVVVRALREAGMEVTYSGLRQTPEMIVEAALRTRADCLGLSILSGAHTVHIPRVMRLLRQQGAEDLLVIVGGNIPASDIAALRAAGIAAIFGPGTSLASSISYIHDHARSPSLALY